MRIIYTVNRKSEVPDPFIVITLGFFSVGVRAC